MSTTPMPTQGTVSPHQRRKFGPWYIVRRVFLALLALLLVALVIILLIPSPIDAAAWSPPPRPALTGPMSANTALREATLIAPGQIHGPEDIVFDSQNRLYTGSSDGKIYRVSQQGDKQTTEVFADTQGRPLGLAFDVHGNLVVADGLRGLLQVDQNGMVTTLTDSVNNTPILLADELVIGRNGVIYFTDASAKYARTTALEYVESRPYGRLLTYDPRTQQTTVLLTGLYFANGVVFSSEEEDALLVVESFRHRVVRYWLQGPRMGEREIFTDNLVGIPDNISRAPDGTFWIALNGLRSELTDWLHSHPFWKNQLAKMGSERLRSIADSSRYGIVVQIDTQGNIIRSLHDPGGQISNLSTAVQHGKDLYVGTLIRNVIGRYTLP